MKAEYINPFLQASSSVIGMMCGTTPEFGKLFLKSSPFPAEHMVVIVGLTGKVKGQITFSLSIPTALNIASKMMGGMEVTQLDELAKSAIGELANMILGNTSTIFYNEGVSIDITPPTILTGQRLEISTKIPTISVPVNIPDVGALEIGVSVQE